VFPFYKHYVRLTDQAFKKDWEPVCKCFCDSFGAWFSDADRRQAWSLAFRRGLPTHGHRTNNICESNGRGFKDEIMTRVKATNMYDFALIVINKVDAHFKARLMEWVSRDNALWVRGDSDSCCVVCK